MQLWIGRTDLTDADIVVGEGRQIVFVEPEQARHLDLGVMASTIVPQFLLSDDYRNLVNP